MDLQEQRHPQLTERVAKVKVRTRPWRAIIALALAIVAAGVSWAFGHGMKNLFEPGHLADSVVAASAAVGFFVFATIAVAAFASRARQALQAVTGSAHAAVIRYAIVLVGGAFATIIITIAGQQALSNIFAGLVLLLSRPFRVGDTIVLRSGALGGQHL